MSSSVQLMVQHRSVSSLAVFSTLAFLTNWGGKLFSTITIVIYNIVIIILNFILKSWKGWILKCFTSVCLKWDGAF